MGRSFFRNNLATGAQKKPASLLAGLQAKPGETAVQLDKKKAAAPAAETSEAVTLFSDVEVCKFLAIERFRIVAARTDKTRGHDWDIVGQQAGMTRAWLIREAVLRGQSRASAEQAVDALPKVEASEGVVTCKVVGVWPNLERVTVEVIATGKREVADVPRIDRPPTTLDTTPMGLGWQFDALRIQGDLKWFAYLNAVSYYRTRT